MRRDFLSSLFYYTSPAEGVPQSNKNSYKQEWEQACLCIEICFELSHDQALAHSCLLLRFLSTGGTTAKLLWFFNVELFSNATAHIDSAWGTGLKLCWMFWLFSEQSSVICSWESVHKDSVATVQTCPDNAVHVISVWQWDHIDIIRIPHVLMESFSCLSNFWSLRHVWLFWVRLRFDWSRKGELHSVWCLHDCGFLFWVENWKQRDGIESQRGCFSSWV